MSLSPKRNYKYNREIPLPEGPINGQALGAVSGMKFGLSKMSRSGCEVIAVYNALLLHGMPAVFLDIARYMERYRVLFGFWGTSFFALGRCLKHYGLSARRVRKPAAVEQALGEGKTVVYVYWCGKRFRSSVHTVVLQLRAEHLNVYNAYNKHGTVFRILPEKYLHGRRMICGYIVDPPAQAVQEASDAV